MRWPTLSRIGRIVGLTLFAAGAIGLFIWHRLSVPLELDAPPPVVVADPFDAGPPVPESIVDAPVSYDLATAVDSLEAAIPRSYGDLEVKIPIASNTRASFAYELRRSPFRVHVEGQTVSISAEIEYAGRVWYNPVVGPELSASCGTGDEPRPRARITLVSTGWLTPDWRLRTKTRLLRLEPLSDEPRDRCKLTILRIDVTDRVMEATRAMLEKNLARFDESAARWPVRPRFEHVWAQLQRPIRLTDGVYLTLNPSSAQIGSVGAEGKNVVARLRLVAAPRIITGPEPRGPEYRRPIPPLESAEHVGSGAHVVVDASFTYPIATNMLKKALVGRSLKQAGRRVRIRDVRVWGIGGGRVALEVMVSGAARGKLYLIGTPSLDTANRQIYVPDLDYDIGTAELMVSGFAWLKGVDIRDFLRERARLPGAAVLGKLRQLAEGGVNRSLAPGVELSGRIHNAEGTSVYATTREIRVRATADAELQLAIDKPPPMPKIAKGP